VNVNPSDFGASGLWRSAHLLRLIEKHISFEFVRERLKDSYSETGRPSIDPELLLRILLIGYLYGITSERKLVEELRMHLAWRSLIPLKQLSNPHGRSEPAVHLLSDSMPHTYIQGPRGKSLDISRIPS
jgi:Transposase domain (DUF772)